MSVHMPAYWILGNYKCRLFFTTLVKDMVILFKIMFIKSLGKPENYNYPWAVNITNFMRGKDHTVIS